jgi:hypothetical protein
MLRDWILNTDDNFPLSKIPLFFWINRVPTDIGFIFKRNMVITFKKTAR